MFATNLTPSLQTRFSPTVLHLFPLNIDYSVPRRIRQLCLSLASFVVYPRCLCLSWFSITAGIGSPSLVIRAVAELLQRHSAVQCILHGHVGPTCPEDIAKDFTTQRCIAVADQLHEHSIAASRIQMVAWAK